MSVQKSEKRNVSIDKEAMELLEKVQERRFSSTSAVSHSGAIYWLCDKELNGEDDK